MRMWSDQRKSHTEPTIHIANGDFGCIYNTARKKAPCVNYFDSSKKNVPYHLQEVLKKI